MQCPSSLDLILGGLRPGIPRRSRKVKLPIYTDLERCRSRMGGLYWAKLPKDLSYLTPLLTPGEQAFMASSVEWDHSSKVQRLRRVRARRRSRK